MEPNNEINDAIFFGSVKFNRQLEILKDNIATSLHNFKSKEIVDDAEKLKQFKQIEESISFIPSVKDILELQIDDTEKTHLVEKMLVLIHLPVMSTEFFEAKRTITDIIQNNKKLISYSDDVEYKNILQTLSENDDFIPVEYKIYSMNIDIDDKIYLYKQYKTLINFKRESYPNSSKLSNWLNTIFNLPTITKPLKFQAEMKIDTDSKSNCCIKPTELNKYILNIKNQLDEKIYGLVPVKERLLMLLYRQLKNNSKNGTNIALSGPPGVAKTTLVHTFAKMIDLPFYQINAASMKEVSFLIGHNFTYDNSGPGCIVQALVKMGYKNGIIYFDEFDKIPKTPQGLEISKTLLHITDQSQNSKFYDQYIGERFNIDLSHIWFIYSINNQNDIEYTLIDRITVINIPGYSIEEQIVILKQYVLRELLTENGLDKDSILIDDDIMRYIIQTSHENTTDIQRLGIRKAKQLLEEIIMKLCFLSTGLNNHAKFSFNVHGITFPMRLTKEHLADLQI